MTTITKIIVYRTEQGRKTPYRIEMVFGPEGWSQWGAPPHILGENVDLADVIENYIAQYEPESLR